ncbi:hypothetical protein [Mesorhizobium carmichaelinearum]|uniref:hypothetical protein n=1 Tax=Mesorhizobium carmichaelinearum TaxID=1208188 RepID=UPI000BA37E3F|nr:hypothetical protein [Mesorhizobium carmichaelinearum]
MSGNVTEFLRPYLAFVGSLLFMLLLIALFFFGVWSRSYLFPAKASQPLRRQLVAGLPVGLITMGVYAKTTLPGIINGLDDASDMALIVGYAIVYGMLSRETLDRILGAVKPPL